MKNWELAKKGNKIDGVRAYADKKKIKFAKIKQKADQKLIVKPEDNNKNKLLADNNIQTETGLTKPDKNSANNPEKISNTPVSDIIIINPSEKDATTNRLYKINYTEIYKTIRY